MTELQLADRRFTIERATASDVPGLVALLADDSIGAARESPDLAPYLTAFREIDAIRTSTSRRCATRAVTWSRCCS